MTSPIVEVTMDCADAERMAEFWSAALGYEAIGAEHGPISETRRAEVPSCA